MKILILEDETEAAENLQRLVQRLEPGAKVVGVLDTVLQSIAWLKSAEQPDLVFSDIQLADGHSFEVFEEVPIQCPVIFTTAYDEYAIKAFQVNSIDYLLKPVSENALGKALKKFRDLKNQFPDSVLEKMNHFFQNNKPAKNYRRSFLVRFRDKILPVKVEDFAFFYVKDGLVYGHTLQNQTYHIENTLEELERQLAPDLFFRANRQFIVFREAISEISLYFNGRLLLKTHPSSTESILVSKERAPLFKIWMEA
jgi:two-component system, LytTR family, response regulator LytT